MDTRLKNYSHSIITKILFFVLVVACFTGAFTTLVDITVFRDGYMGIVFEDSYFTSSAHLKEGRAILAQLTRLIGHYKNEEHILSGETLSESVVRNMEDELYWDFKSNSKSYDPNLSEIENFERFKEEYAEKLSQIKKRLINEQLENYHSILSRLEEYKGVLYYASDGENTFTNSARSDSEFFASFPSYILLDKYEKNVYPGDSFKGDFNYWGLSELQKLDPRNRVIYISFTDEYLSPEVEEWKETKQIVERGLIRIAGFLLGLILSFAYLALVSGRKSFRDKDVQLHTVDRLYNDINIVLCIVIIGSWFEILYVLDSYDIHWMAAPITASLAALGLMLLLSMVKHIKNRTLLKHTLVYTVFYKLFNFLKAVYDSGSVGMKVVLAVIGYPVLVAATFFMFPVTIGAAAWLALKKVKQFDAIKEGVAKIKEGDLQHTINVEGKSEFAKLAGNINSIADGLKKAVESELKSERMKTELITNVSHDIRTPLTSIITYVDLLKREKDQAKQEEYINVLEQKSQRLKTLTDDLFEAAKASSGSIPVNLERIDIVSLITQGLGELNEKIEESELKFKLNHPDGKVYVAADGRLLWRVMENLLSNIFKYTLKGSRVYIDIEDMGNEVRLAVKNISAYELNVRADELMERFTRGDESRSSQGSGLGLSIAKSLIEIQKGRFKIEIDGDLFKAIIHLPAYRQ